MIRGIQNGKAIIFYFLQPDKNNNLILRGKESPPTSTNKFIIEEYYPGYKSPKSIITPSWTGYSKLHTWKPRKTRYEKSEREIKLYDLIVKLFGYNENTHPTSDKILRLTKGEKDGRIDFDMEIEDLDITSPSNMHYDPKGYYSKHPKRKEFISLVQEQKLLTNGQFEEKSYPAISRKRKVLKPKIKNKIERIKCRCKNE